MNFRALAGIFLFASLASGCDLSPQPLPPQPAGATPGGTGTSSGSGAPVGQASSGTTASAGAGAGADVAVPNGPNGSTEEGGLALTTSEASVPLDASVDSTIPAVDAAFDSADAGAADEDASEVGDVRPTQDAGEAGDVAAD
jgi:hypothetical protein